MPNCLNQPLTLLICLVLASQIGIGCGKEAKMDTESVSQLDLTIHRTVQGQDFKIPAQLEFNGQKWTRDGEIEARSSGIVTCYYVTADPNIKLRYSQWPKRDNLKEVFSMRRRVDQNSSWIEAGKQKLVRWGGVWYEFTADPELGGLPNGPYRFSYEDGTVKFSGYERNFSRVGLSEGYYPDGSLWWKAEFVDDLPEFHSMRLWSQNGIEMKGLDREEKLNQYHLWNDMKSEGQYGS